MTILMLLCRFCVHFNLGAIDITTFQQSQALYYARQMRVPNK